jgi:para-nitrobenzyl esterase
MKGHSMWRIARFYDEMMFRLPAVEQAVLHHRNGGKAYMYFWTVPSSLPKRKACHAVELSYVFGNLEETIYTGESADEKLSDTVIQMWTNFARTGDPSVEDLRWEEYTEQKRATMVISKQPNIKYDVLSGRRILLAPLLRHMINPSYATLDYNVPFVRKTIAKSAALIAGVSAAAYMTVKLIKGKK